MLQKRIVRVSTASRHGVNVIHFLGALVRMDAVLTGSGTPLTIQLPASELPPTLHTGSTVLIAPLPVPALAV